MMKKMTLLLAALLLLCLPALAEMDMPAQPDPEGWSYVGYMPAGVTFLIPEDTIMLETTQIQRNAGIIMIGMNDAYTLQLRRFTPDQMDLPTFCAMLERTNGVQIDRREVDGVQIVCYRNTTPTGVSELYGVALTGTDGCMYKISVFTGVDEDYSADAPVWAIAEQIAQSVTIVDYSTWPVAE